MGDILAVLSLFTSYPAFAAGGAVDAARSYFDRLERSGYEKGRPYPDRQGVVRTFEIAYFIRLNAGAGHRGGDGLKRQFVDRLCSEARVPALASDLRARLDSTRPIAPNTDDARGSYPQFFEMLALAPELWSHAGGTSEGQGDQYAREVLRVLIESIVRGRGLAGSAWDPHTSLADRRTPLAASSDA